MSYGWILFTPLWFILALLLRAPVTRWLRRALAWKPVVATNAVIMTIFLWHMTALLVVPAVLLALGVELRGEPTAAWWWERPFWLLAHCPCWRSWWRSSAASNGPGRGW